MRWCRRLFLAILKRGEFAGMTTPPTPTPTDEDVEELIADVERPVLERRDSYRARARWNRRFFRSSGVVIIAMASALPVLASFSYRGKDVLVAVLGALIAFLTALRSFYRWDQLWGLLRKSDLDISHLLDTWTLNVQAARATLPPQQRMAKVQELAEALLEDFEKIRRAESQIYFDMLRSDLAGPGGQKDQQPST
jgi:hypothetical protein